MRDRFYFVGWFGLSRWTINQQENQCPALMRGWVGYFVSQRVSVGDVLK